MKRSWFLAAGLAFGSLFPVAAAAADPTITVFAAASLRAAFEAAAPAFTKQTGIGVTFNFGGSDTLATQIAQGAPADVFASANVAQMQKIGDANLTSGAPQTFARNRLVVIVPKSNPGNVKSVTDLSRSGLKLILAAPTVPVGSYARAAFTKLAGQQGTAPTFSADVEKNVISNELDVKAVATKVALGEGDAGVVYTTDVTPKVAANVSIVPFPPGIAPEASYPIAVLKAARNSNGAQAFVEFVLGNGRRYLQASGFISP